MPHLQFDLNKKISKKNKKEFVNYILKVFSQIMKTGKDHVAVTIREFDKMSLLLGRVNYGDSVCLMNLDIRKGRTSIQKRELVLSYIEGVTNILGINKRNQYITFTEHKGQDFHLVEKCLEKWSTNDDPLNK